MPEEKMEQKVVYFGEKGITICSGDIYSFINFESNTMMLCNASYFSYSKPFINFKKFF